MRLSASSNTPQVRVGVAVFVWKDGKFLFHKRRGSNGTGTWSVPGGHLEFGETLEQCATREVLEESGLTINNVRFLAITNDSFASSGKQYISIWMTSDWAGGKAKIMEPDRCTDQQWCDFQTLPEPLFEPCWINLRAAQPDLFKS